MGGDGPIGGSTAMGLGSAWSSVPHPVIVADAAGIIRAISAKATTLLPQAVVGAPLDDAAPRWLSHAHRESAPQPVSGSVQGKRFEAHPTVLDGEVAWWLVEEAGGDLRDARQALTREQARTAFLDEASAVLMATLNVDRCTAAAVQLATRHLADAAAIVAPLTAHRILPVVCGDGSTVEQRQIDADPAVVAGLNEALRGFPPVPPRWHDAAALPDWLVPQNFRGSVGSVLITPLPGLGVPAGALVLMRRTAEPVLTTTRNSRRGCSRPGPVPPCRPPRSTPSSRRSPAP